MARNWAITIGINGYCYLQRLKYAKRDAESIRQFFNDELKFERVYHFAEGAEPIPQDYGPDMDAHPSYITLKRFFRKRFDQPFLREGDNLWCFFAGHGIRDQNRDYLMPIDGDRGDLAGSAIPIHYISERLRRSGADNVILLIDACRSYEGRRGAVGIGEEKQQGVITLFSCSPEESSYEIQELEHGAFTHVLIDSLRLQGEDNCATVERLYQRLRYYVPQLTQKYKRVTQTPYGVIEPLSKNHLILLPGQAMPTDVVALKNAAYKTEMEGNLSFAQQLWIRCLEASPADQDAVAAIRRIAIKQSQQVASGPTSRPTRDGSRGIAPPDSEVPAEPDPLLCEEPTDTLEASAELTVSATVEASGDTRDQGDVQLALGNGVILELVSVPGGSFLMGSPDGEGCDDEKPRHEVTVQPFLMGKYPVTQAQWKAVAALPKVERDLDPDLSDLKGDNRPVECVSWDDAVEFCKRLSKITGRDCRLPSEAEWEYACRAGTTTPYYFGDTLTSVQANYQESETTDVGRYAANAWGFHDMHGNVYEWCLDHWHESYERAPTDASAWTKGGDSSRRVLRGGSWLNDPDLCRSAKRHWLASVDSYIYYGFRVVCASSWTL
ncbi:SUMF1/EgtB/PvdO family nonheme iron enzyme [Leptothoe sp. ISB3NOV94-8A]